MINIEKIDDVIVVRLSGRIDVQFAIELERQINEVILGNHNKIVFDLKDVQHLSSSGIRVIISTFRKTTANKGGVKLARVNQSVRKILKLVELDNLFTYYDTVEEAIKSF